MKKNTANAAGELSHLDERGHARMVDVGDKAVTQRMAIASGEVQLGAAAWAALVSRDVPKGDVIATARIAGIQAAKRTAELIPLCHPLPLTSVAVEIEPDEPSKRIRVTATVRCEAKTGAEMEAMSAVSVSCLTIYDMLKGIERGIVIGPILLVEKSGGKSGYWKRVA